MAGSLPEFDGWAVDEKLHEFRRVWHDDNGDAHMDTRTFASEEGAALYRRYAALLGRDIDALF